MLLSEYDSLTNIERHLVQVLKVNTFVRHISYMKIQERCTFNGIQK